ncbi:halovibrin HvnA [Aliivibrio fischeri]|uniref:halovibrin HvnA n=1 Tax=Aliivibrio fischeri TaxID=668 RepID=UPI000907F4B4|nr:halovibrin HvnA [Aliivibrio fischeri]
MKFIKLISWFVLPLSFSVLANDVSDDNVGISRSSNSVITQQQGSSLVDALRKDYNDTSQDCNGSPAFLCSGITFRGNKPGNYHVWNPSPNAIKSGGVSFSYLRKDSKYSKLAYGYDSGYIIYQIFGGPKDKIDLDYLCFYPIDAATNTRAKNGCGTYPGVSGSQSCDEQGIYTASAWKNHYSNGNNSHTHQCSFNLRENASSDTTQNFAEGIKSMAKISTESFGTQNELRLAIWDQNIGDILPIQTFFYTADSGSHGRDEAQSYQKDFYQTTGIAIPVIKLTLPNYSSQDVQFTFDRNDQAI